MAKSKPCFVVVLPDKDQWFALRQGLFKAGKAQGDPKIRVDEGRQTVEFDYSFREINAIDRELAGTLGGWGLGAGTNEQKAVAAFGTAAYQKEVAEMLDAARDAFRDDAFNYPAPLGDLGLRDDMSPGAAAEHVLGNHAGMVLGNSHNDTNTKELLYDSLQNDMLTRNNVGMLFIEEFTTEMQAQIDAYMELPPNSAMPPELLKRVQDIDSSWQLPSPKNLEGILTMAQAKGVKVYGIDSCDAAAEVDKFNPSFGEQRVAKMNKVAHDVMKKAKQDNPNVKFLALCGAAHSNTHQGGVPGLAQFFDDVPAMQLRYGGRLVPDPEDATQRGMPSKVEQRFIDAYIAAAGTETTGYQANGLTAGPLSKRAAALAKKLMVAGKLNGPDDVAAALKDPEAVRDMQELKALVEKRPGRRAELRGLIDGTVGGGAAEFKSKLTTYLVEDPDFLTADAAAEAVPLLHHAVRGGNRDCAAELIEQGANVNGKSNGETPLHLAQTPELAKLLIEKRADVAAEDRDGETALHRAAAAGHLEVVTKLRRAGARLDGPNKAGETALLKALKAGKTKVARALIDKGASVTMADRAGTTPLHAAAANGHKVTAELLVTKGARIEARTAEGDTPLLSAVKAGKDRTARALLRRGADVNAADNKRATAMHAAARAGNAGLVDTLLNRAANADTRDADNNTPLQLAAAGGHDGPLDSLILRGADVKGAAGDGRTPLHTAAASGNATVLQALLAAGADLDTPDGDGNTPLHLAIAAGHGPLVNTLLQRGARVDRANAAGDTALHLALGKGDGPSVDALLAAGAPTDVRNAAGESVLELAARVGGRNYAVVAHTAANNWNADDVAYADAFLLAADEKYQPGDADTEAEALDPRELAELALRDAAEKRGNGTPLPNDAKGIRKKARGLAGGKRAKKIYTATLHRKTHRASATAAAKSGNVNALTAALDADPALIHVHPTLLHAACWDNLKGEAVIPLLLGRGANVFAKDDRGATPLHRLLRRRADEGLNAQTDADSINVGLDRAARVANLLIDSVNDPQAKLALLGRKDGQGRTPMHLAALSNHPKVIKKLLDEGADDAVRDNMDMRPIDVAVGSTKAEAERMLNDEGTETVGQPLAATDRLSSVDILVRATLCENPDHRGQVAKALKELYANPLLRPILDLAALDAMKPRVLPADEPDNTRVGGVRLIVADGPSIGTAINKVAGNSPQGAYDEKTNAVLVGGERNGAWGEHDFAGVLIHELTHLATRIVYGKDVKPCDDRSQVEYVKAIEKDVADASLFGDQGSVEANAKDIVCGRMTGSSYAGIGDKAFLTEFIVGVPQLMAEYGPDGARQFAPELTKVFENFSRRCEEHKDHAQYDGVRQCMSNGRLLAEVDGNPGRRLQGRDKWLNADKRPDVNAVMAKVETLYKARRGVLKGEDNREGVAPTIKYDPSVVKLEQGDPGFEEFQKQMRAVRKGLEKAFDPANLPPSVAVEDYRRLVKDCAHLAWNADDPAAAIATRTEEWTRQARKHYLENKAEGERKPLAKGELAELVVLKAEDDAWKTIKSQRGKEQPDVNPEKHQAMIRAVVEKLDAMDEGERTKLLEQPRGFIKETVGAVTDVNARVFKRKEERLLGPKRDPNHMSVDKGEWMAKLATI